jgi:3-oxoacyl-(acyl-carrier-protein) synthase
LVILPKSEGKRMTRVVITGLGAVTPVGNDVETFWQNMKAGNSGAGPITRFDDPDFPVQIACEVKDFDPTQWMSKKLVRRVARSTQFSIASSKQALADSGFEITPENSAQVGMVINTGAGGLSMFGSANFSVSAPR